MQLFSVLDPAFAPYGRVVEGYTFAPLIQAMQDACEAPTDKTLYTASIPALEQLPLFAQLSDRFYGGMPIQIGCCSGGNRKLNCLEYHRDSELNVAANDVILLLAPLQQVQAGRLDTGAVQAFLLPAGKAVQLYETTLHFAPCLPTSADSGFRVAVVLPRGTNTEKPTIDPQNQEDRLLWARNKWLIAHSEAAEAQQGAFVGLMGENIIIK